MMTVCYNIYIYCEINGGYRVVKLKVIKLFNYAPAFDMYVVDFIREAGKTMAVTISEDNKIENWNIEDLEIDFQKAIKE